MTLAGKTALVTGATGNGIGRSIALTLAREHATVIVNYRHNLEHANQIVKYIRDQGGTATPIQADIFIEEGCGALVEASQFEYDHIDICVINPGGGWHAEPPDQIDSNLALDDLVQETAPVLHLLPLVLPDMYERNWGRIIAITTNPHLPSLSFAYNAGKSAREQILFQAHRAAWPHNVTMNVVALGPVNPIEDFATAIEQCEHGPAWQARTTTSPQDIAESVAFLCSEAGQFITGGMIPFQFHPD